MAFTLENVVPWGRNIDEYDKMFDLKEEDKGKRLIGFGDGPASFNYEHTKRGGNIVSLDPIYQFTKEQIKARIDETKELVMKQARENQGNFIWDTIKSVNDLEYTRMNAMEYFLDDYEEGKGEGRYLYHELPNRTKYPDDYFDLGLSSHFLLLYTNLGEQFHVDAINEMLRICKEIRIFPIVDLDGKQSDLTKRVIDYYCKDYDVQLVKVPYEFQKGANEMLKIKKY